MNKEIVVFAMKCLDEVCFELNSNRYAYRPLNNCIDLDMRWFDCDETIWLK